MYTTLFEEFWKEYPRKVAKPVAFKAWQKQIDESDAFMARAAIDDLKKRARLGYWVQDKTKIPHGSTWINARRWEDEGWEFEIKTRGKEDTHVPYQPKYADKIEDDYGLNSWQTMLNRVMRSYVLSAQGVSEKVLAMLVRIKNDVYAEMRDAINEDIECAEDKSAARHEAAHTLVDLMLSRFDTASGLKLRHRILSTGRERK